ncbi:hypothetical protein FIV00_03440 [Labrenzia sp. THAF82]|uniref:hypothetical protein n=1 Tax=Labrenzia sp. THAF82 TaxID=2587861 RepID=UPI001267D620|nr:hypothetical protein [Labrenzia sp. THAF82]QFT29522.1 hypothetical protein FIV00_03440 [Labrenzia sp. THAF82]
MRLRKYMYSGLIAATLTPTLAPSLAVPSALAQSLPVPEVVRSAGAGEDGAAGEAEARLRPDLFAIAPVLETDLTTDAAVPLEFRFARPPEVGGDVQGVNAEGFVRRVRAGGNSIAQVVVSRLTRGADYVDLEPQDFTSQFVLVGERLLPTTEISIDGDEAEFLAALARLSTQAVAEEDEPEEDAREEESSGDSSGSDGNEDGGSSNPIAGGYQTPERLAADEDEPTVTYDVTTEGCEPVVDLVSGVVRQQSMSQTLEDGVVVENDACSPNGVVWPIEKNYDACEAIVDIDARLAFPQFETFYTDDKGARYDLEACQPDEANYHVINEDFDACTPEVDFEGKTVALLSSLSYRNRTGEVVSVSECAPSNKTFELERDYSACDDFVDLEGREASAQYTYFYVDGQASRHTVSACRADTERTWPIEEREECALNPIHHCLRLSGTGNDGGRLHVCAHRRYARSDECLLRGLLPDGSDQPDRGISASGWHEPACSGWERAGSKWR